jgi:hypothetical protein
MIIKCRKINFMPINIKVQAVASPLSSSSSEDADEDDDEDDDDDDDEGVDDDEDDEDDPAYPKGTNRFLNK